MCEWKNYKVSDDTDSSGCKSFGVIHHVTHINPALEIIQSGKIKPIIISDQPELLDSRIPVCWFSPNEWFSGNRYGNVRLTFLLDDLIKGKKIYWAGTFQFPIIQCCRFLITGLDRSSDKNLQVYDPTAKDGPWWHNEAKNIHYFNDTYAVEFMIDEPISLNILKKLDFVEHHKDYCSIHSKQPDLCKELGKRFDKGSALFLTRAIMSDTDLSRYNKSFIDAVGDFKTSLVSAFMDYLKIVSDKTTFSGSLSKSDPNSIAVMKAVMGAFTFENYEGARIVASHFRSEDDFIDLSAELFTNRVGLRNWEKLINDAGCRRQILSDN